MSIGNFKFEHNNVKETCKPKVNNFLLIIFTKNGMPSLIYEYLPYLTRRGSPYSGTRPGENFRKSKDGACRFDLWNKLYLNFAVDSKLRFKRLTFLITFCCLF